MKRITVIPTNAETVFPETKPNTAPMGFVAGQKPKGRSPQGGHQPFINAAQFSKELSNSKH